MTEEKSFFAEFCEQYHVTEQNNTIIAYLRFPGFPKKKTKTPIFTEDKDGNLDILVYTLDRELISVDHPQATPDKPNINNNRSEWYTVKRFKNPKEYTGHIKNLGRRYIFGRKNFPWKLPY